MKKISSKSYIASSLLEVLITLFVISVSMIAALNVVIRASTLIKDNEIQDTVNDLVLQTYELIRSSDLVSFTGLGASDGLNTIGTTVSFRVRYSSNPVRGYLEKSTSSFTSCELTSGFLFELPQSSQNNLTYPVCIKVDIQKTSTDIYAVTILVRYSTSTNPNNLDTYVLNRFGGFSQI